MPIKNAGTYTENKARLCISKPISKPPLYAFDRENKIKNYPRDITRIQEKILAAVL